MDYSKQDLVIGLASGSMSLTLRHDVFVEIIVGLFLAVFATIIAHFVSRWLNKKWPKK